MQTTLTSIMLILLCFQLQSGYYDREIITAISDNGCSKPPQIELKATKSNADVYNYAALSTSY